MKRLLLFVAALTFAAPAFAQVTAAPPSVERKREIILSIYAATQAPDFNRTRMMLEVYRTLRAAGATLPSAEAYEMGELARHRGLVVEAFEAYSLLQPEDQEYRRNVALIADLRERALQNRQGGVEKSLESAKQRAGGDALMFVAEAFAGLSDHQRAVEVYELAFSRIGVKPLPPEKRRPPSEAERAAWAAAQAKANGRSIAFYELEVRQNPGVVFGEPSDQFAAVNFEMDRLNYGISLFRLNRVADARAVWGAIEGNAAAMILAKAWIDIADRAAN